MVFVAQGFTTARTSLVEMFILAQADQLFISPHSTFSTTAAALSGVRVLLRCWVIVSCLCAGLLPMTIYNSRDGCELLPSYEPCSHAMCVVYVVGVVLSLVCRKEILINKLQHHCYDHVFELAKSTLIAVIVIVMSLCVIGAQGMRSTVRS